MKVFASTASRHSVSANVQSTHKVRFGLRVSGKSERILYIF
jgi:hypothetical protein